MEKREEKTKEIHVTTKQSSSSNCSHASHIPFDLTRQILLHLPAKSVMRFRCVSKLWASVTSDPDFTELFLTRSSTRPRLLFAVEKNGVWSFFSSPQPQPQSPTPSSSLSPPVVSAEFHTKFSGYVSRVPCSYAAGLIFFPKLRISEERNSLHMICNPITGKYVSLPCLSAKPKLRGFLGFDPIDKQSKVLADYPFDLYRHNVLSLGGIGDLSWRVKKCNCPIYYHCLYEGICINGVLHYLANWPRVIVCFDVRSEEFKFIEANCFGDTYDVSVKLINYKGKLAGVNWKYVKADGRIVLELCLWVLEVVEERKEWVKSVFTLTEDKIVHGCNFSVVGMTGVGEIVLAKDYTSKPYYVFFFDPEKNTLRCVEIQGFGDSLETLGSCGRVRIFVDYVEDLNVHGAKDLKSSIFAQ